MARRPGVVLAEILAAISGIESAVAGKTFEDFQREWLLKRGVERGLEIISEATRHIPQELRDRRPQVPWREIGAMGNVLRHEYHKVADAIVWRVVTDELPRLRAAIEALKRDPAG